MSRATWTQADDTRDAINNGVAECRSCMFWTVSYIVTHGDCRRRAPVAGQGWPRTRETSFCGEWDSGEHPLSVADHSDLHRDGHHGEEIPFDDSDSLPARSDDDFQGSDR